MQMASLIVSIVSAIIAIIGMIITIYHNRKLHNENIQLSTQPSLAIDLLYDSRIGGHIYQRKDGIDSFNVWESKYTQFYVDNEVMYNNCKKALFTIQVKNNGKGVANDIQLLEIKLLTNSGEISYSERKNLFVSCAPNEILANKIYLNQDSKQINSVELLIQYRNLINQHKLIRYYFNTDPKKAMLRYVKEE